MILFQNDYKLYPNAIIDYRTPNDSFLRTAKILHSMGIKNWAFPLVLLDQTLQGVDPFDPGLSNVQRAKIGIEAKLNPWFTIREIIRIPELGCLNGIPYKLNRANLFTMWSFFNHVDVLLIHLRQTGKSTSVDGIMTAVLFIMSNNCKIHLVTKDSKLRQENIERIKEIRDLLPPYFYEADARDANNKQEVTNVALHNQYASSVAQSSIAGANKVGRGMKAQIFLFDEAPYITNIECTMPSALSAATAARDQAKRNNDFYGNIITTTAGMRDTKEGEFIYEFLENGTPWTEALYDSENADQLLTRIRSTSSGDALNFAPMLVGIFSHRQLGYSDEWLREKIASSRGTGDQIKRDYLNIWTLGSLRCPISEHDAERIFNSVREPPHVKFETPGYMLRWYYPETDISARMNKDKFVLGLDTSDAIGKDDIGFVITSVSTLEVVAVATINESNLIYFSHWLANFMILYKGVTLVIEMAANARAIVDVLLIELPVNGEDPFKRIYNQIIDNPTEHKEAYRDICRPMAYRQHDFYTKYRKYFGFRTNEESRRLLYGNVLQLAAKRAGHLVRDEILSREIRGLVVKNDRIDHANSGKDDACIAWLLGHWFLTCTGNHASYGIDASVVMKSVIGEQEYASKEEKQEAIKQENLKREIDVLVDKLSEADNTLLIIKLECKIRSLTSQVTDYDNELYNIDSIVKTAREIRERRLRNKTKKNSPHSLY